jgi:hypothetical protein
MLYDDKSFRDERGAIAIDKVRDRLPDRQSILFTCHSFLLAARSDMDRTGNRDDKRPP